MTTDERTVGGGASAPLFSQGKNVLFSAVGDWFWSLRPPFEVRVLTLQMAEWPCFLCPMRVPEVSFEVGELLQHFATFQEISISGAPSIGPGPSCRKIS